MTQRDLVPAPAPPEPRAASIPIPRDPLALAALKVMRPKQWTKNGLLAAALVFSGQFFDPARVGRAVLAVLAFNLLSSSGYVLNDYLDREADRKHPKKRFRPIASGSLPEGLALPWMIVILLGGLGIAFWLSPKFLVLSVLYLATTISYSLYFKHKVILDVMFLAACYVWRAIAGAVAIEVRVSPWFFLCTAFFALFLGFAKRKAELVLVGDKVGTRKNLREYSPAMLEQFQVIATSCTIVSYALYTVLGTNTWMMLTIPYVLFAVFRYIYLVDQKGEGGAPDETLLKDVPTLVTVGLYVITAAAILSAEKWGWLS
jgi:4-hydroxybenzoate polyprenyltransferase